MSTRLYEYLLDAVASRPDHTALEFMGHKIPYKKLLADAMTISAGLVEQGIKPGDSVGVMLPNIPDFVNMQFGILMTGAVMVPFNVLLRGPEIEYLVRDSNIKLIVTFDMFASQVAEGIKNLPNPPKVFMAGRTPGDFPLLAELAKPGVQFKPIEVDPALPIMTIYTSGTTGKPKGAQITNRNVAANLDMIERVVPTEPEDRSLCVLPLFHVFALFGVLNASLRSKNTVILHPRFEVESCVRSLVEDNITTFCGVPTMYFYILKHPKISEIKFPRLRSCFTGGAAMPVEVLTQFEKATGAVVYEGFGLTETTVSVTINRRDRRKIGSIGLPFDDVQMKIVDDAGQEVAHGVIGEIVVKSPNVMIGYLNKKTETAEAIKDGWFHTGDLGYQDDEGFFYIVDRKKDMIIKGGLNIYPREIEEVIYQLPEVAEAAVVGIFDEAKGEIVRAVVSFKPGKSLTPAEIEAHLTKNLAKYKLPQEYEFMPELPKGPTGKILKRELRQLAESWNKDRVSAKTS